MEPQKISILDYIRVSSKETNTPCLVNLGDLVCIKSNGKADVIGIVTQLHDDKMCLLINAIRQEWWSRYVNCEIISYNNTNLI